MYLAGSFLMFLAFLTVIGVLISDLALALLDPRIRLPGRQHEMNDVARTLATAGARRAAAALRLGRALRLHVGRGDDARRRSASISPRSGG